MASFTFNIAVISSLIIVLFQCVFIGSLINSFYCSSKSHSSSTRPLQCVSLSIFISIATTYTIWIIEEYFYQTHNESVSIWSTFYILFFINLSIGFILFYILMLMIIHYTFKNSQFRLTNKSITYHIIIIFCVFCVGATSVIAKIANLYALDYAAEIIVLILCALSLSHLIWIFNSKLFRLVYTLRQSQCYMSESARNLHFKVILSDRQLKILDLIRKQTLSGCCMVYTFLINSLIMIIYGLYTVTAFFWICWSISLIFGTFNLYLSFTHNRKKYDYFCKKCDYLCSIMCNKIAQNKLQQIHNDKAMELNAMSFSTKTMTLSVEPIPENEVAMDPQAVFQGQYNLDGSIKQAASNKEENNDLYNKYIAEYGKPERVEHFMNWARQKGRLVRFSDAKKIVIESGHHTLDVLEKNQTTFFS